MNVSFNGYNEGILTFEAEDGVTVGAPVEISENGKVKAAENVFFGICTGVRDGFAAVQLDGYIKVKYSGTLTHGYNKLISADGKVKADTTDGREILVVDLDAANNIAGIIL